MNGKWNDTLIDSYLDTLAHIRKLSLNTRQAYAYDLSLLQQFAQDTPLVELQQHQLRLFAARLNSKGYSPASIARILSAWRSFYAWLVKQQTSLNTNPIIGVRAPRRSKKLPKALSVEEAVALAQYNGTTPATLRDHAICELFYSSGLRLSELVQLDWRYFCNKEYESMGWLDLDTAQVTLLGKGGKRRIVPVGSHACIALRAWLQTRSQISKCLIDPYALFISNQGKRIAKRTVQLRLKTLAQTAGIPTPVHPHMLRHSCASHFLQSSGDLRAVQEMLGHANISSTQIYTALDFQHLAKMYDLAHPRAKRKNDESDSEN